ALLEIQAAQRAHLAAHGRFAATLADLDPRAEWADGVVAGYALRTARTIDGARWQLAADPARPGWGIPFLKVGPEGPIERSSEPFRLAPGPIVQGPIVQGPIVQGPIVQGPIVQGW